MELCNKRGMPERYTAPDFFTQMSNDITNEVLRLENLQRGNKGYAWSDTLYMSAS
jgi:hypothetical protein